MQIFPDPTSQPPPTRLQERLLSKLGKDAFPFHLEFPNHSPNSVLLVLPSLPSLYPNSYNFLSEDISVYPLHFLPKKRSGKKLYFK